MEMITDITTPEERAALIFECSRCKVEPSGVEELWHKILQHKWVLSEKLGRDVGSKVACLDFIQNIEPMDQHAHDSEKIRFLKNLGATMIDQTVWETISESQPPKKIVNKRIILPFSMADLARKHGVMPPRALIFFGPPRNRQDPFCPCYCRGASVVVRRGQCQRFDGGRPRSPRREPEKNNGKSRRVGQRGPLYR
jgi:hypothetical protein